VKCQHHNLFSVDSKIDSVREKCQHCAPSLAVDLHERPRVLGDAIDQSVDGCNKSVTESSAASLVPPSCFDDFVFGFRPKDNGVCQLSAQQLAANLGPLNGGAGITLVFDPTAIEFGALFVGELKRSVPLRVA